MRVVAGELGGRRIVAPRGLSTRPTSDRVREALFSALGDVTGARVHDLYAGTGALAIEALSRGAAHATLVESERPALAAIRENVAALGLGLRAVIVASRVARTVPRLAGPFDLAFVDPPYAALADAVAAIAALRARFAPSARVVLEHASRDAAPDVDGLARAEPRVYGDTALTFYTA